MPAMTVEVVESNLEVVIIEGDHVEAVIVVGDEVVVVEEALPEVIEVQVPGMPGPYRPTYEALVPGNGAGVVNVDHNLNQALRPMVAVWRTATGAPVVVPYTKVNNNRISLDFDTYARAAGEFSVTVWA